MNFTQIESNVRHLTQHYQPDTFIYDLLLAYGQLKASIKRLQIGSLNLDVFDQAGQRHTPREWFIAPLDIIEQAVHLIISGEIVKYRYEAEKGGGDCGEVTDLYHPNN